VESPKGKSLLGRPRHRWVEKNKMDLRGIVWGVMDWIYPAQNRGQWKALVSTVMTCFK
jgi:hypothetical protein